LHAVDAVIDRRRLLTHPFYVQWQEGGLSQQALRDYAVQYYRVEKSLVSLAAGEAWAGEQDHPELWLRFADALGLSADDVRDAPARPATQALVDTNDALAATEAGRVGALYAYESQAAAIAVTKASSLREHYGVTSGLEFFQAHSAVEDGHAAAGRQAMAELDPEAVERAVTAAAEAHWAFLDQALEVASST
jgi:pyrroloquinoline-quinone synthase